MRNFVMIRQSTIKDVRIIKTLKSIDNAFLQLLDQKGYDNIIVQDILDTAMINRTTFYKYYNNKAELACDLVARFKTKFFIPMINQRFSSSWDDFSKTVVPFYEKHHATLKTLWHIKLPNANLENDFYDMAKSRYLEHAKQIYTDTNANHLEFQAHLYASFAVAMVTYCVKHDSYLQPDEVQKNLNALFEIMVN